MRGASDITIAECINAIEETFPTQRQDNWDNSGLLVGDINITLRGVLISVDITEDVINEAIEKDCNLIISHHPIMFRGIKQLIGSNEEQRIIITAIKHNIVLYASHTCLDKSAEGTSRTLGNILNLKDMKILIPEKEQEIGYGVIGVLPTPISKEELMDTLKEKFGCPIVRHNDYNGDIRRVAICTGSGSEFIDNALQQGADAYITGDVKYHQFSLAEKRMLIADIGHYESEECTKQIFLDILRKKICTFARYFVSENTNLIKYY